MTITERPPFAVDFGGPRFAVDRDKLAAAVAYLAERSLADDAFGETKLVTLLYYADCAAYVRSGQPITGAAYIRRNHMPCPQDWPATERMLERKGVISVVKETMPGGYQRHRLRPAPAPAADTAALTELERAVLDEQLLRFADFSAGDLEQYFRDELVWYVTAPDAVIPFNLVGIRRPTRPPSAETLAHARRVAKRIREQGRGPTRDVTPQF